VKHFRQWLFHGAAALSLLLCRATISQEILRFPDVDFSFYWTSRGSLISVDSFEDVYRPDQSRVANAITVRKFSPWPSHVPFQFRRRAVETGNEVPGKTQFNSTEIWVDDKNQPVSRDEPGHQLDSIAVTEIAQIPIHGGIYFVVTAILPVIWCVRRRRRRSVKKSDLISNSTSAE
jgi:hypothetical protein